MRPFPLFSAVSPSRRESREYLVGVDGIGVEVPGWAADWLERQTDLAKQRIAARGVDPALDEVLLAIRRAAVMSRSDSSADPGADLGTTAAGGTALLRTSGQLTVNEAAGLIGIQRRAVRKACTEGRLPAVMVGSQWLIQREDAANYQRRRTA